MPKRKSLPKPKRAVARAPDRSDPKDPGHAEWLIDEASEESFPASDPSEAVMPRPHAAPRNKDALSHIEDLVREEHRLFEKKKRTDGDTKRLKQIAVELDRCWDLLRQRRAATETGGDPSKAKVRPADVVEKYIG